MEKVAQLPELSGGDAKDLLMDGPLRSRLEGEILPAFLFRRRWFRSKTRKLTRTFLEAWTRLPSGGAAPAFFAVLVADFETGESERYALPLGVIPAGEGVNVPAESVLCRLRGWREEQWLVDGVQVPDFRESLFRMILLSETAPLGNGLLRAKAVSLPFVPAVGLTSRLVEGEQSNTSLLFPGHFLKLYRHLQEGIHPEPEMLRFLERAHYPNVPPFRAELEWERPGAPPIAMAVLQKRVENGEDGWDFVVGQLSGMRGVGSGFPEIPQPLAAWIRLLGRRTAELHGALASSREPDFAPEPLVPEDLAATRAAASGLLNGILKAWSGERPGEALRLRSALSELEKLEGLLSRAEPGETMVKIRVHGDFHLGQVLRGEGDVWFLDFEGEPARSMPEKRLRHPSLRDVAGMLRSFHYAAHAAFKGRPSPPGNAGEKSPVLVLEALFLESYYGAAASGLLPGDSGLRDALLDFFVLEKAIYELHYELNHRPDWAEIPLRGLAALTKP